MKKLNLFFAIAILTLGVVLLDVFAWVRHLFACGGEYRDRGQLGW